MTRQGRVERRVYAAHTGGYRYLTWGMLFVSFMLLISGVIGKSNTSTDLAITPSSTPAPTPITRQFDETADTREVTLPQNSWYAIQLGIYESESAAQELADNYRQRGAAGYIWPDGDRYRILAAVYPSKEDAAAVRTQLRERQSIDSYVFAIEPVTAALQISGMKGQLDALEACFDTIESLPLTIQGISVALDRQETDLEHIKTALLLEKEKIQQLISLLNERFTKPAHPVIAQMDEMLHDWQGRLSGLIASGGSEVFFAGELKRETLALIESARLYQINITQ